MGKAPKKGLGKKSKPKHDYVSREQALRHLQLSLPRFRELCILKGIHPRPAPSQKGFDRAKPVFSRKDIIFMANDPLITKFREWRVFVRRLRKAHDKQEANKVDSIIKNKPKFNFDHLVKERYPTFKSALNDLDDCLTLVFLFSRLPAGLGIEGTLIESLKRLCDEFSTYVVQTRSLRKVFLSIKGIYYQANIMNQIVTWCVPYDFPQDIPADVEFKVFKTFLQFYQTQLKFINFKLYHSLGMEYPPKAKKAPGVASHILEFESSSHNSFNTTTNDDSMTTTKSISNGEKSTSSLLSDQELQSKIKKIAENDRVRNKNDRDIDIDDELEVEELRQQEDKENAETFIGSGTKVDTQALLLEKFKKMFDGYIFFISRECPRGSLEFVIRCFGGQVACDSPDSKYKRNDERITHEIMDRPLSAVKNLNQNREYIQPQWVYDSINARTVLPPQLYKMGQKLPPHLSPFVDYEEDSYIPKYALQIRALSEGKTDFLTNEANVEETVEKDIEDEEEDEAKQQLSIEDEERQLKESMLTGRKQKLYMKERNKLKAKQQQVESLVKKRKLHETKQSEGNEEADEALLLEHRIGDDSSSKNDISYDEMVEEQNDDVVDDHDEEEDKLEKMKSIDEEGASDGDDIVDIDVDDIPELSDEDEELPNDKTSLSKKKQSAAIKSKQGTKRKRATTTKASVQSNKKSAKKQKDRPITKSKSPHPRDRGTKKPRREK